MEESKDLLDSSFAEQIGLEVLKYKNEISSEEQKKRHIRKRLPESQKVII